MSLKSKYLRFTFVAVLAVLLVSLSLFHFTSADHHIFLRSDSAPAQVFLSSGNFVPSSQSLGVASKIYVISLPRRADRRMTIDALSRALGFEFDYVNGVEATDASVYQAMSNLKRERKMFRDQLQGAHSSYDFSFPYLEREQNGDASDALFKDTLTPTVNIFSSEYVVGSLDAAGSRDDIPVDNDTLPLPCATPEDPFPPSLNETELSHQPHWRILSRGMVACWMVHLEVIRKIARQRTDTVTIVLEDDVDIEFDINQRLVRMWPALPANGWDIVMLGHCHSEETKNAPLPGSPSLRPSFAPKCTHAYALSRVGAQRLLRILSTPGFAFSRALDQAISWLIKTKRLRSFSVVPAIVVQSKRTDSDIWSIRGQSLTTLSGSEKGSKWRDYLADSTLERLEVAAAVAAAAAA